MRAQIASLVTIRRVDETGTGAGEGAHRSRRHSGHRCAAHPAGAMAAVKVPRSLRTRRTASPRFEYQDATQAVDRTWIDEQQLVQSSTPAGDDVESGTKRDRSA